jgi:biopolymer transport protein ExbD
MKLTRPKRHEAIIPTASMADIAFLLIIFFMVTTVYDLDRTSVELPTSVNRVENEKGAAIVVLHQDDNGNLVYKFSDGEQTSNQVSGPGDISLEASRIVFQDSTKQFILKADGDIRYEYVDELLDTLRGAGAANVLLLTAGGGTQGS